jgi:glycerol-3-phosphate cytidylyltransferase
VTTDELCQETKGKTPVIPFHQRMEIVKGLSCVDSVVSQNDTDKVKAMDKLGADILFVGDDHYGEAIWNRYGSEVNVVYLPYTNDISASRLRKRIYDQA